MDFPQLVVHKFGDIAVAVSAHFAQLAHGFDHGANLFDHSLLTAHKHRHIAPDRRINRPCHGRIDRFATFSRKLCRQIAH